ncbi:MAG: DUF6513 domain-containing protein [Acidobacteriota bacterium]
MSRCLFVTGKLAAPSLRKTLESMDNTPDYECAVLPISVAALMDASFVTGHLSSAMGCNRLMIPGLCSGDFRMIEDKLGVEVVRGPKCLKDIPSYLGESGRQSGYGDYTTSIMAEIVDAYRLSTGDILERAEYFRAGGADIIDLGCPVEGGFENVAHAVAALKAEGYRVSVDSFNETDILNADRAGVDYLLSVNSRNLSLARSLQCKVVVIPDIEDGLDSLERNVAQLEGWGVRYIIDPVLKPIGFGFVESIGDFIEVRRKFPEAEILMGTGNITELTDADTTGVSAVRAGIVAELGIQYVLTTEVIHWARGAVREMDIARRLMHYACSNKVLPKHLETRLITVKDPPFETFTEKELRDIQKELRDRNYRIFTDCGYIYLFNSKLFIKGRDVQEIFEQLNPSPDASQAFYLGRELEKAALALRLGKRYIQEESLRWGYLSSGRSAGSKE